MKELNLRTPSALAMGVCQTRLDKDQIRQTIDDFLSKRSKIKQDYVLKQQDLILNSKK